MDHPFAEHTPMQWLSTGPQAEYWFLLVIKSITEKFQSWDPRHCFFFFFLILSGSLTCIEGYRCLSQCTQDFPAKTGNKQRSLRGEVIEMFYHQDKDPSMTQVFHDIIWTQFPAKFYFQIYSPWLFRPSLFRPWHLGLQRGCSNGQATGNTPIPATLLIPVFEQRRNVYPTLLYYPFSLLVCSEFTNNKGHYAERSG